MIRHVAIWGLRLVAGIVVAALCSLIGYGMGWLVEEQLIEKRLRV